MKKNVINQTVKYDLCIGCGVCAFICPSNNLSMNFDSQGKYAPVKKSDCLEKCDLCLKICPFGIEDYSKNENSAAQETFINPESYNFDEYIGYYKNLYVGYINDSKKRESSTSGGIARFLLAELFDNKLIDYAIHVVQNDDPDKLFAFSVARSREEILTGSKSAYYPVEMSEVLEFIKNNEGNYAITALPCFTKALRSAQKYNKQLRDRIKYIFGLTCGQMKSKQFLDYIAVSSGLKPKEPLKKVDFRAKSKNKPASNYHYEIYGQKDIKKVFWQDKISNVWCNRWFTLNACEFCDDIFAELADVSFMDAWLPDYSNDWQGTNIVVSRSEEISRLLEQAKSENKIYADTITPQQVIESQRNVIDFKRKELPARLHDAFKKGNKVPQKRVEPQKPKLFSRSFLKMKIKEQIRIKSFKYYPQLLNNKIYVYKIKLLEKLMYKIDNNCFTNILEKIKKVIRYGKK